MFKVIISALLVLIFTACTNNRPVAMNEYQPPMQAEATSAAVTITPKMIEDLNRRKSDFLKHQ